MTARVRRTCRVTGLERAKPKTGGLAVCCALAVTATVSACGTSGRRKTGRSASTVVLVVLRFVVLGSVVLGFVFVFFVVVIVMALVWFFVTTEDAEERTGWPDWPNGSNVEAWVHCFRLLNEHRFTYHLSGHDLSVFD